LKFKKIEHVPGQELEAEKDKSLMMRNIARKMKQMLMHEHLLS
jgi:hypothetical protein